MLKNDVNQLSIKINTDPTFDEVIDSISDLLESGIIIESTLKDGFQISDILAVLQVQPKLQEIYNDVPVFVEQFLKLKGSDATAAVIAAKERITAGGAVQLGKVTGFILNLLFVAASNYSFAESTYIDGQRQYLLWKQLIAGNQVLPEKE